MIRRAFSARSGGSIPNHPLAEAIVVCVLIFVACMVGIHTRLLFSLGSIWPANALLLGWLISRPHSNHWLTWLMAALGYVLADLISGSALSETFLLNGANLVGVAAGIGVASLRGSRVLRLQSPDDVVTMIIVIATASASAAVAGALIGPPLFGMTWTGAFGLWLAVEFVNHAIYVPVVITMAAGELRLFSRDDNQRLHQLAALACLLALTVSMSSVGGPGAPAYVVPGLLWCAIAFRPFANALLAAAIATWILIAGPLGLLSLHYELTNMADATSFRLAVGMIAVGAFAVSAINSAWRQIHADLRHMASHDTLTGLLNRGALLEQLNQRIETRKTRFMLLLLDIDRFKAINDTYGHAMGDRVLQVLADTMRETLPPNGVAGRLGGEEFAILVDDIEPDAGAAFAEQFRAAIAALSIPTEDGTMIGVTISIGAGHGYPQCNATDLLAQVDNALYAAKRAGRNRVVHVRAPGAPDVIDIDVDFTPGKRRTNRHKGP